MRGTYYHHRHHHGFHGFHRKGICFLPFLLIGFVVLAIIVNTAPWLPLLVIGFIAWRVLSQRGGSGWTEGKPKRDFSRRYWDDGETKPKRGDDSEYV